MKLSNFINGLQIRNRFYFSIEEALEKTKISKSNLLSGINYYKKKGFLMSPMQGFYIIIPLTEQGRGGLKPEDIIVLTMQYLNIPYYVGLLSASSHHGATHQPVHIYQVVSSFRIKKTINKKNFPIVFIYKKDISNVEIIKKRVRTGSLFISTPEETAKDVMTYYRQCGGLNHQATVLSELTESINEEKLISLAKRSGGLFWVQRMGYILEHIDTFYERERDRVVNALENFLRTQKIHYVKLAPEMPTKGNPRDKKWKIIENSKPESDI